MGNLVTVGGTAAGRCSVDTANHVTAQATAAPRTKGTARFVRDSVLAGVVLTCGRATVESAGVLMANNATAMSPTRCRRSFTRQPMISATIAGGTAAGTRDQSGSRRTTAPRTSV